MLTSRTKFAKHCTQNVPDSSVHTTWTAHTIDHWVTNRLPGLPHPIIPLTLITRWHFNNQLKQENSKCFFHSTFSLCSYHTPCPHPPFNKVHWNCQGKCPVLSLPAAVYWFGVLWQISLEEGWSLSRFVLSALCSCAFDLCLSAFLKFGLLVIATVGCVLYVFSLINYKEIHRVCLMCFWSSLLHVFYD